MKPKAPILPNAINNATSDTAALNGRFAWIMSAQYFLFFGVLGVYLPYFNLYCYHLGFDGFQIGLVSAARSLVLVSFSILWGIVADRFQARRAVYITCNVIRTGLWLLFLAYEGFHAVLVITVIHTLFFAPIISFMEAFTIEGLGDDKRRYGRIRVWGTVSFIGMVVLVGKLVDSYSLRIIIFVIFAGAALQSILSVTIPKVKITHRKRFGNGADFLRSRPAVVFLASAFLMLASHGTYYGFFSIHLEELHFGTGFIGVAWAFATGAEIVVMLNSGAIFRRFRLEHALVFSFIVAALRWTILFLTRNPYVILASQMLHAVTYGVFHIASILYIDRLAPEESKTTGQAVNNALTYGLGNMTGLFLNGYLFDRIGVFNLYLISGGMALLAGLILYFGLDEAASEEN